MGGNSPPKPPDPLKTAQAQTGTNVATAVANQVLGQTNQITPYGNLNFNQTGSYNWTDNSGKRPVTHVLPQYTATQTLNKDGQRLQNAQVGAQINLAELGQAQSKRIGSLLGKPMDLSNAPKVRNTDMRSVGAGPQLATSFDRGGRVRSKFDEAGPITKTYGTDFSADRQKVEDALMQRMSPGLEQGRSRLESQLANQGLQRGTEAWDNSLREFGTQENDARLGAILAGGQEQSRMVGMEANRAAFENQAQNQQFGQNLGTAQFANQAQGQRFGQNNIRAQFGNDGRQQMFGNDMAQTGFNNSATQQNIGNDRADRSSYLSEQYAQRNQPLNEIASLLGTGQVQQPNFVNTPNVQMPTVDYAGLVNQNYNQKMQNYQQGQQLNPWLQAAYGGASMLIPGL